MEGKVELFEKELKQKLQTKSSTHSTEEATLLKAFKYFDMNNSGRCEPDEFVKAIARIGISGFNESEIASLFGYYDVDGSGALDYKEFVGQLYSNQSIARSLNAHQGYSNEKEMAEEGENALMQIRQRLASRGVRGITDIARNFKVIDDNYSQTIDYEEFKKATREFRFGLNEQQLQAAFAEFDKSANGEINYDEFLCGIRGKMNQFRRNLVAQAFDILDKDRNGRIELSDIKQVYNARKHPDVLNGKRTEEEVLLEFLETFESHHHYLEGETPDHMVSLEEFIDYYENVSMSIDDDAYFEVMMNNAWRMNANTAYNNQKKGWRNEEKGSIGDRGNIKRRLGKNVPQEGRANLRSKPPSRMQQVSANQPQQQAKEEVISEETELIFKLRTAIVNRGGKGIIGLGRLFKIYDDNGSKALEVEEFAKAMKEYQLGFNEGEIRLLFKMFDRDQQGTINYEEFLRTIRGEMNEVRKEIVKQAFVKMDYDKSGKIDMNDIKGLYDTKMHPDVMAGKKTPEDIYLEFLDTFEAHHAYAKGVRDKKVTLEEFIEYYTNISMSIDDDEYFIEMIKRAWKLTKEPVYSKQKAWVTEEDFSYQPKPQAQPTMKTHMRSSAPYGIDNSPTDYQVSSQFKCKAGITKQSACPQSKQAFSSFEQSVSAKLSSLLSKRGTRGIMSLRRSFMIMDDQGNRRIGLLELSNLFKDYRIDLTPKEAQELFVYFDRDNSGFIDYEEFVRGIVGEMSSFRRGLTAQAFNAIDSSKTGRVSFKEVKDSFNAQAHPDVLSGRRNDSEVLAEFIDNFEYHFTLLNIKGSQDKKLSLDDFIDFYSFISMAIDNDAAFQKIMTSVWNFQ